MHLFSSQTHSKACFTMFIINSFIAETRHQVQLRMYPKIPNPVSPFELGFMGLLATAPSDTVRTRALVNVAPEFSVLSFSVQLII